MVGSLVRRVLQAPGAAEAQQRISVQIQRGWWDGTTLTFDGCAFAYGRDDLGRPVSFEATSTSWRQRSLPFDVRQYSSIEVDTYVNDEEHEHASAAFVASIDLGRAVRRPGRWKLEAGVPMAEGLGWRRVTWLYRWGSAWHLKALDLGRGLVARFEWDAEDGLVLVVERPAVRARAVDASPGVVELTGSGIASARLVRDGHADVPVAIEGSRIAVPSGLAPGRWLLEAVRDDQPVAPVWDGLDPLGVDLPTSDPDVRLVSTRDGRFAVDVTPEHVVVEGVDRVRVEGGHPAVTITGRAHGVDPRALVLSGPRVDMRAHTVEVDGENFRATYVLWTRMPWARAESIVPPGGYRLMTPNGTCAVPDAAWLPELYQRVAMPEVFLRYECDPDGVFYLHTSNPRTDDEMGPFRQRRLQLWHRQPHHEPLDAVLFESFSGRSANDNTAAIAAELIGRRPDLTPYWSVVDRSVAVPDGITPVLRYSREWWGIASSARLVVTNSWLPGAFARHAHQRVMQAWHGTPYKTLGIDRIGVAEREGRGDDVARQAATWSQMIAQNPFAADAFRSAYRLADDLEMLTIGYPRNDVLVTATDDDVAAVRARLGVRPGQQVVTYMPTWREDSQEIFAELDLDQLTTALGPDTLVLVRGHSNTIKHGRRVDRPGIIDVTLYPDAAELYLATDVLVTDYSSAMFDFSVTGRPIIFFTPDIERYVSTLRGVYFDLAATAPGPLLGTTAEVVDAVRDIAAVHAAHADRYRAWRERFNPFDDGRATERAVDALVRDVD